MSRKSPLSRLGLMLMCIAALAFGAAACGSDEETSSEDVEPAAEITDLTGDATTVALNPDFLAALESLKVKPGTVGDATLKGTDISFPITGGSVTYYDPAESVRPYVQGILNHAGSGLSLTNGDTTVELTDFVINPGTSKLTGTVTANGKEAATDAVLFDLDGSTLKNPPTMEGDATVLEGTTVLLSEDAAGLLNDTFAIKDLAGGLEIGISSIAVTG